MISCPPTGLGPTPRNWARSPRASRHISRLRRPGMTPAPSPGCARTYVRSHERTAFGFDVSQRDVGVEPRIVRPIADLRRRPDDRFAKVGEPDWIRAQIPARSPEPFAGREKRRGPGSQGRTAERLDGRGDGQAELIQVAVPDVSQERQGDMVRWSLPSIGIREPSESGRPACGRASSRSARESGSR